MLTYSFSKQMRNLFATFSSQRRQISQGQERTLRSVSMEQSQPGTSSSCELDSHADTCALGSNFISLYYTGQQCNVTPFSPDYTML
jgi:hypothetical protein